MTNILNTLNSTNTNVLPARKLTKQDKKNVQIDYIPQPLYKYSLDKALKEVEQKRLIIEEETYKNRTKNKKKKNTFPFILGLVTATFIFLQKKVMKQT